MVNIKIDKDKKIIEIDGTKLTVDEYNRLYTKREHPTWVRVQELYDKFSGCQNDPTMSDDQRVLELKKSTTISGKLWLDINNKYAEIDILRNKMTTLWPSDFDIEDQKAKGFKKAETFAKEGVAVFQKAQELLPLLEQMENHWKATGNDTKKPLNDPLKDQDRGDLGKRAKEIEEYRKKTKQEIENFLNQDPKIANEDLEVGNQSWVDQLWYTIIALGEKEIDDIKKRVLADIEAKRNAKKGKRKRDQENDSPSEQPDSKKPKLDDKDGNSFQDLKNKTLTEIDDNTLAAGLKVLIRMEGEKDYKDTLDEKMKPSEDELIKRNSRLYRETVIAALNERIKDGGVKQEDLDEETRKLINGEINDANEVKKVKNQAIKSIGEASAKGKWTSLFNQAEEILQKTKKNITEKVKEDIKIIQEQIKSFKSGANSYLMSFYQNDKTKVNKLEKELSSSLETNRTGSPNKTPWGIIVPVSLIAAVLAVAVAAVVIRRRRKQIKK